MKVELSAYLKEQKKILRELITRLAEKYNYVSVLGTDTTGKRYNVQMSGISVNDSMWVERGFVVRVHNGRSFSEFSFNQITADSLSGIIEEIDEIAETNEQLSEYPLPEEKELIESFAGQVEILPDQVKADEKIEKMKMIKEKAMNLSDRLVDFRVGYEEVHLSKVFLSGDRDLEQSFVWSQAFLLPIARAEGVTKYFHQGYSGLKGVEILDELEADLGALVKTVEELLSAERVKPGEYEVICTPDVAGVIAHEAFGHGVETDMFVKNRARAVEYLDKQVASELVTMHDGATAANDVGTYLFDDEGTLGSDSVIIDQGILKMGISDRLSAMKLGIDLTGNGRRESFERKAYARMTNTFFGAGDSNLEEMISSIDNGYLLDGVMSGMEDPKNWGIQCMISLGREIKDGKLTGRIISPVIMTGYVPDVLKSISMVSSEIELYGTGYCGKGHKEFVKTSAGGPYIKTKVRLG